MEHSLSDIISSIGVSVQTARRVLEESAVELYFKDFYEQESGKLAPITKELSIPQDPQNGAVYKTLNVPVTALCSHNTITLEQVNINMRLMPCTHNDEIVYQLDPPVGAGEADGQTYAELSLTFSIGSPPEGMARLNQESINLI